VDAAVWYTQLDQFDKAQILESRLYSPDRGQRTDDQASSILGLPSSEPVSFLDELASALPAPGGGSAAAYAGAMGAALVAMVSGLTIGRKKYAEVEAEMQAVRVMAEKLRAEMTQAVDDDAASFEAVIGALKLPKDSDDQQKVRTAAIQLATMNAAHIPLHSAKRSVKIMELAVKCAERGNLNAISDAMSGFAMSRASLTAAAYNVRVNVNSLPDKSAGDDYLNELAEFEKKADALEKNIRQIMKDRAGI
jgi:glutamate formiminotransferase/formiminotetrahydrofolate cyclodeaminase